MQQNQKSSHAPRRARSSRTWKLAGAATVLGGLAVANAIRARKAVRDNPPIGQFIKVDGVCLHYVEKGSGPPILLVHGNGVMVQDWMISGLFDELAKTQPRHRRRPPGFGYSSRRGGRSGRRSGKRSCSRTCSTGWRPLRRSRSATASARRLWRRWR
jgi:hypothetical protein